MGVLRKALPLFRVPRFYTIVTRFAHVQEVLAREEVFQVPFATRMSHLIAGPKFVLAMQDGDEYRLQRREIMQAFRLEDVAARIAPRSAGLAAQIVEQSGGRIDAVEELLTRVPTILCREYYGLNVQDPKLFAQWTLAVSAYVFGSPWGKRDRHTATAQTAANCLGALIDESIRNARRAGDRSTTIVARLVGMQEKGNGYPTDDVIRTELFGMIVGFVPTNTIASGNILEMLLRRGDFMEAAQAAARADDDERLWRCLFETLRFKPINSGLFRECVKDHTIGTIMYPREADQAWHAVAGEYAVGHVRRALGGRAGHIQPGSPEARVHAVRLRLAGHRSVSRGRPDHANVQAVAEKA